MSQKDRNQLKPPFIMIFRGDMIICMIVPSPSAVSEHVPMPGQTEWCQRNKDQITLHTGGSRGAPTRLFITSSVSTYVYSCTYNGCQFLPFAPTPVFWGFTIFFFFPKKRIKILAAYCTYAEEHTSQGAFAKAGRRPARSRCPGMPEKSICASLSGSIPLSCWRIRMLEPWIMRVGLHWCHSWHQFITCSMLFLAHN